MNILNEVVKRKNMATKIMNVFELLKEILLEPDDIETNHTVIINKSNDISSAVKKDLNAPIKAEEIFKNTMRVRTRAGIANVKPLHSDALAKAKQKERDLKKKAQEKQTEEHEQGL